MNNTKFMNNESNESSTVQFYRYPNLRSKALFKVQFLGFELVKITNMSLDPRLFKPTVTSQSKLVDEVISGHIVRIGASASQGLMN